MSRARTHVEGGPLAYEPNVPIAAFLEALSAVLAQVAEPVEVLRRILDQAVNETGADRGIFVEVGANGEPEYRVLHRVKPRHLSGDSGYFSQSIFAHVLRTGEEILIEDARRHPEFMRSDSVKGLRLVSILCMPIHVGTRVGALVHLENDREGHFREGHRDFLRSLLAVAGPLLEAVQAGGEVLRERAHLQVSESRSRQETEEARQALTPEWSFRRFVGRSAPVRELEALVRRAAGTDFPVLLVGESGTGKNIVTRILHHSGPRASGPFVTLFCPALQREMVEAELFGHRRGAFTGAVADRIGKVQAAEKGTLFLDEIGELPLEVQPKLLRLLQEKAYETLGDHHERRADVRVVAATNRDLEVEVAAGRFRRDLFERLNYVPIRIPPLRERKDDIPLLLRHCLDQQEEGRWIEIAPAALDFLEQLDFAWPGNVRHLEQLAVRLALEMKSGTATQGDVERLLGAALRARTGTNGPGTSDVLSLDMGLPALLAQVEKSWLQEATRRYPHLTRAELAQRLKISESVLYRKLRQYGI